MYTVIIIRDGFRVITEYPSPERALEAFEAAGKHARRMVGAKVQLCDGGRLVSEFVGPEPKPAYELTEVLARLDPERENSLTSVVAL